ncbi:hypothetical protein EYF80_058595 [Liparis tanakae]|uniref:Uncharacterized protein n=1 Tax=Liparis tanakae TaxID=230148 RepID=A0A4Z2ERN7_9TELE|nr:hypothetical protein EYF80_058595 [Liparis tanakae]
MQQYGSPASRVRPEVPTAARLPAHLPPLSLQRSIPSSSSSSSSSDPIYLTVVRVNTPALAAQL